MEENIASYEASSFAVDATKLHFDRNGKVELADFPAFVHEWWHFIQDVTTITGQNGFYLWLRDIIRMTSITCSGEKKIIQVPLPNDQFDEVYSKYRQLYNIFCGAKDDERFAHAKITKEPEITPNGIYLDGETRTFARCEVEINNKSKYFGLIALQELNAYYAQKIVEGYSPNAVYNIPADSLPEFPYKVGDMLFNYYGIETDLRTRFIISSLVLDTLQAPTVFLYLLKALKGRKIDYFKDKDEITILFQQVSSLHSYPKEAAYNEWIKDYANWVNDSSHVTLREAIRWYLNYIVLSERFREKFGFDHLPVAFSCNHRFLSHIYSCFPVPLIKIGEEIMGQHIEGNELLSNAARHDFENAMVIWFHRRIYDLLRSKTRKDFNDNSSCLLYNNGKCQYLSNYSKIKNYDCKMSPWTVVKEETKALCPYAMAAHSMGLWQNDIDIVL